MRRSVIALATIIIVVAPKVDTLGAQAASPPVRDTVAVVPSVALPSALDRVLRDYERAWRAGDAAALALLFAEDGFVLQGGSLPVRGRDAIRAMYAKQAGGPLRLRAIGFATADSVGYILGAYGYENAGPGDVGKFTLTLRRARDGRWLINSDMDNLNPGPRRPPS